VLWKKELLPLRTGKKKQRRNLLIASHHHRSAISYFGDDAEEGHTMSFELSSFFQMNDGRSPF
jgi:hypothetical protein